MADGFLRDRVTFRFIFGDIVAAAYALHGGRYLRTVTYRAYTAVFRSRTLTVWMAVDDDFNNLILIKNGTALVI